MPPHTLISHIIALASCPEPQIWLSANDPALGMTWNFHPEAYVSYATRRHSDEAWFGVSDTLRFRFQYFINSC